MTTFVWFHKCSAVLVSHSNMLSYCYVVIVFSCLFPIVICYRIVMLLSCFAVCYFELGIADILDVNICKVLQNRICKWVIIHLIRGHFYKSNKGD